MLTYLDANLHPEKYARDVAPGSPLATLPSAVTLVRKPPGEPEGLNLPLAWGFDPKTRSFDHGGGTFGAGSYVAFYPERDLGIVALYNRGGPFPRFVDRVGQNVYELIAGEPAHPVDYLSNGDCKALDRFCNRKSQTK
jgi:serine-type D-Ala-D-Ala carboxypeptidase/endopeptidase